MAGDGILACDGLGVLGSGVVACVGFRAGLRLDGIVVCSGTGRRTKGSATASGSGSLGDGFRWSGLPDNTALCCVIIGADGREATLSGTDGNVSS